MLAAGRAGRARARPSRHRSGARRAAERADAHQQRRASRRGAGEALSPSHLRRRARGAGARLAAPQPLAAPTERPGRPPPASAVRPRPNGHGTPTRHGRGQTARRRRSSARATAPQLRRFIKSRAYVPMHELRRRFAINGGDDDVTPVDLEPRKRVFVGLPEREGRLLGELLRAGDIGYELSLDPISPIVVGVYPMRPVTRV